jgi:hypothetical protein
MIRIAKANVTATRDASANPNDPQHWQRSRAITTGEVVAHNYCFRKA